MGQESKTVGTKSQKIKFYTNYQQYSFFVIHNLDKFGLDIWSAVDNWLCRTEDFSVQSFCDYVVSKDPINFICIPKAKRTIHKVYEK